MWSRNVYRLQICSLALLVTILIHSDVLNAQTIDLVINGEFEKPDVIEYGEPTQVPGWITSESTFEIWDQGMFNSPPIGSDGLPTGQHMEMDADSFVNLPTFSQSFVIPDVLFSAFASFSFDAWLRYPGISDYAVEGSVSGVLVAVTPIAMNNDEWTRNTDVFSVVEGETITLSFIQGSNTNGASGAHIDQVEFVVNSVRFGDINRDGVIDLLDVQPFVDLLVSGNYQLEGDVNWDGRVDLLDVTPFIDLF